MAQSELERPAVIDCGASINNLLFCRKYGEYEGRVAERCRLLHPRRCRYAYLYIQSKLCGEERESESSFICLVLHIEPFFLVRAAALAYSWLYTPSLLPTIHSSLPHTQQQQHRRRRQFHPRKVSLAPPTRSTSIPRPPEMWAPLESWIRAIWHTWQNEIGPLKITIGESVV